MVVELHFKQKDYEILKKLLDEHEPDLLYLIYESEKTESDIELTI